MLDPREFVIVNPEKFGILESFLSCESAVACLNVRNKLLFIPVGQVRKLQDLLQEAIETPSELPGGKK